MLFFQVVTLSILRGVLKLIGSKLAYSEQLVSERSEKQVHQISAEQWKKAKDIAFAIELGQKYLPWRNFCRHQSWQAIVLLKAANIPFTYHIGIKKGQESEGHAWVMVGGKFISGKCSLADYQELSFQNW